MLTPSIIGILSALLAAEPDGPGLREVWRYNGVDRPVLVEVIAPEAATDLQLLLLDAQGNLHVEPIDVSAAGTVDIGELMPQIWRLRRAAYLQLSAGKTPLGSALVVQPMLSRMVPDGAEAMNPNGIRYTEIERWVDEFDKSVVSPPQGTDPATTPVDPLAPHEDPWLEHHSDDGRLVSGMRVYPDRDVVLHTTLGDIRVALRPDEAPNTVWSFLTLCDGGFYRGITFHRVVPMSREGDPFVIQAGDPTSTGSGGPGYWLPIEPSRLPHDFGVISMARDLDPDSAGSQFFFALSRAGTARLDGHYCAFGMAVDGAEIILDIAGVPLADVATGRPVDPPVITSAELVPAPPRVPGMPRSMTTPAAADAAPRAPEPDRVPR